jgi:mannose-6-phosphate isomerase class I
MDGPQILYETPAEEFQVSRISLTQESGEIRLENANPAVLLVLGGMINISWENNKIITSQEYHQGQAILIPAVLNPVWLNCAGCAELIQATVPGGSTRQAGL